MIDGDLLPVICDFGLSKEKVSKAVMFQNNRAYYAPEKLNGKIGIKGDIFSLGLVFVELGLLLFGQKSLKEEFTSGFYADITEKLVDFLRDKFPLLDNKIVDDWNKNFIPQRGTSLRDCLSLGINYMWIQSSSSEKTWLNLWFKNNTDK